MRYKNFNLVALFLLAIGMTGIKAQSTGTFADTRDGKVYKTVQVGNQVWLAENLAYKPSEGKYYAYDNLALLVPIFGYLYDWETAKKVCPAGWHLPSDAEWTQLIEYLGGEDVAGGKLKEAGFQTITILDLAPRKNELVRLASMSTRETGTGYWLKPNSGATNESGFSALPAGYNWHGKRRAFEFIGRIGVWWSATEDSTHDAWDYGVNYDGSNVGRYSRSKRNGFSVRCLRN